MYTCVKCSEVKPVLEFYARKNPKLRYDTTCKKCRRLQRKERYSDPEIKAREKALQGEYRNNPENKARKKEYDKEYYDKPENKARKREYDKAYGKRQAPKQHQH